MELHDKGTDRLLADIEASQPVTRFDEVAAEARRYAYHISSDPQIAEPIFRMAVNAYARGVCEGMDAANEVANRIFSRPAVPATPAANGDTGEPERFSESEGPCDLDAKGGAE